MVMDRNKKSANEMFTLSSYKKRPYNLNWWNMNTFNWFILNLVHNFLLFIFDLTLRLQMVTILFGANDVCSAQCYSPKEFSPIRYALHLRRALDFLRASLPRTIVNLIPALGKFMSVRFQYLHPCVAKRTNLYLFVSYFEIKHI